MIESLYLKLDWKPGQYYKPIELNSFPFPIGQFPDPMPSCNFFIEVVEKNYYLRSLDNPFYCTLLSLVRENIEMHKYGEDGSLVFDENSGEYEVEQVEVAYLMVRFGSVKRMVAYYFRNEWVQFLVCHFKDKPYAELDLNLRNLYKAAQLNTEDGMAFMDDKTAEQSRQSRINTDPKPVGVWEEQQFREVFGGDSRIMSDSEYEMIFGEGR
jgi:hypothetical protein